MQYENFSQKGLTFYLLCGIILEQSARTAEKKKVNIAGWSSLVARRAHNPKVVGSNPAPATTKQVEFFKFNLLFCVHIKVGIRVNAIAPGFFASEQNAKLLFNEDGTPTDRTKKILAATPMGHFGDSEKDLVGALLFLLNNDAAGFITGICLPVDGGFSAYSGV